MPRIIWRTPTSKYHAKRAVIDGQRFDSRREATRYAELVLLQKAGRIRHLECQPEFPLNVVTMVDGRIAGVVTVAHYRADFAFEELLSGGAWTRVIEDAKGVRTPVYRLKRKWFEAQYRVPIREV